MFFYQTLATLLMATAIVQAVPVVKEARGFTKCKLPSRTQCSKVAHGFPAAPGIGDHVGIKRFAWVSEHLQEGDKLARSSAPNYRRGDTDQYLSSAGVKFLQQQGITHVISLNSAAHSKEMKDKLKSGGIAYTPLPVRDFGPPTLEDLKTGWEAFKKNRTGGTLVWCGYGHGRTGTMISALQLYAEHERSNPKYLTYAEFQDNLVEKPVQFDILRVLKKVLIEEDIMMDVIKKMKDKGSKPDSKKAAQ
ncbi:protein-tyrosine phosphatase [Purpureocillium lavendulum]|uniref:Protein-tyrosine phosphatase n=1 Tax=Purpureocillium lavendulum TaxID=1247861 RepID=A0AB34G4A1_9HYPO|nr:protein-tyrosine phosphatase [Purpureocillium lavendulum]